MADLLVESAKCCHGAITTAAGVGKFLPGDAVVLVDV